MRYSVRGATYVDEHSADSPQGATVKEQLIEACRTNNTELFTELLEDKGDDEIALLLNNTTTVMGNHLYHEAASKGNCKPPPSTTSLSNVSPRLTLHR
jgi:hypothetical protein